MGGGNPHYEDKETIYFSREVGVYMELSVIKEVVTSLNAHEIIKIRVFGDDRKLRVAMIDDLCSKTGASLVQHIGKLIVLYRQNDAAKIVLPKK